MRKTPTVLCLALALGLAGVANARSAAGTAGSNKISLHHTSLGTILVAPNGFTLYQFSRDRSKTDNCQNIKGCMSIWPALVVSGTPQAGGGVSARLLGTIRLKNGKHQVTYGGHPLYRYSGDTEPGQTEYVGAIASGGTWTAINAQAKSVK